MKNKNIFLIILCVVQMMSAQQNKAFQDGEWFKFKMSYSNFLKAGEATLEVKDEMLNGKSVYHVIGNGWTTGMVNWFFPVKDLYESYFDKITNKPYKFIRKINEGGHTKDIVIDFDHASLKAHINNKKYNKKTEVTFLENAQDMISAFYYLRNTYDTKTIKIGEEKSFVMFFDAENFNFKLKFLGYDTIETKFGKVKCLKFRPSVLAGRVFKEKESLTLWVSHDDNKMPLRLKANLAVGSMRADLIEFKGLKHPFKVELD